MIRDFAEQLYRKHGLTDIGLNRAPFSFIYKTYVRLFLLGRKIPPFFNLEPTNHCNLECVICPSSKSTRKKGFISLDLVKKITGEVARHGGRSYFLFKDGEPLLHQSFFEIVEIIKKAHKGNRIYVSTNGHRVNAECIRNLIDHKVDNINFSIDNATPEGYRVMRGASLDIVERNINDLMEAKRRAGSQRPHIALHFVKCEENRDEIELFKAKWKNKPVTLKFMFFNSWTGLFPQGSRFDGLKRYPCFSLWMFPSINWDGTVSICCVDWNQREVIGDLNRQSFEEIWNCDRIREYRAYHLAGEFDKIPICASCNIWASRPNFLFSH